MEESFIKSKTMLTTLEIKLCSDPAVVRSVFEQKFSSFDGDVE